MKKSLLIAGGSLIILLLIGLWVYLLFFGTPKNVEDVFTSFNFGDAEEEIVPTTTPPPPPTTQNPLVNITGRALRQLTTRPVIGFREVVENASSSPYIYYAESGTGHVYSINLTTGEERRISGTTVTGATRAEFSDDGQYMVIQSGTGRAQKTSLGKFADSTDTITLTPLSDAVDDFTITSTGELLYTVKNAVTTGKTLTLSSQAVRSIFTLPFRDATIIWGNSGSDTHYAYPKTSYQLESFVYSIKGGTLTRLPIEGYGLVVEGKLGLLVASRNEQEIQTARFYDSANNQQYVAPFTMFPEKCVFSTKTKGLLWCASFVGSAGIGFPDTWYTGETSSRDDLYQMELTSDTLSATKLVNTFDDTGREVDSTNMSIGASEQNLYFINKNDNSLWMYDLAL